MYTIQLVSIEVASRSSSNLKMVITNFLPLGKAISALNPCAFAGCSLPERYRDIASRSIAHNTD